MRHCTLQIAFWVYLASGNCGFGLEWISLRSKTRGLKNVAKSFVPVFFSSVENCALPDCASHIQLWTSDGFSDVSLDHAFLRRVLEVDFLEPVPGTRRGGPPEDLWFERIRLCALADCRLHIEPDVEAMGSRNFFLSILWQFLPNFLRCQNLPRVSKIAHLQIVPGKKKFWRQGGGCQTA